MSASRAAHRSRARTPALLLVALSALALAGSVAAPRPGWSRDRRAGVRSLPQAVNVTILGPLADINPTAINDAGQVAGVAGQFATGNLVRYDPGVGVRDLGALPGLQGATPTDINENGDIVGTAGFNELETRGFLYRDGGVIEPLTNNNDLIIRRAYSVNEARQVVVGVGGFGPPEGALWQQGAVTALANVPGLPPFRVAKEINASGAICGGVALLIEGQVAFRAVRWPTPEQVEDLSPTAGPDHGLQHAEEINNSGQVLLWQSVPTAGRRALLEVWLRQPGGGLTQLGFTDYRANSIHDTDLLLELNDSGQVLLRRFDASGNSSPGVVLWQDGQEVAINSLLPAASGYRFVSEVRAFNNRGQMLAQLQREDGPLFAAILTPKAPETAAPVISITSPAESASVPNPVAIRADIADDSSVQWILNVDESLITRGTTRGPNAVSMDLALPEGAHSFTLTVADSSGNRSSTTRRFNVGTAGPAKLRSFSFASATVRGGQPVTGQVELTAAAPEGGALVEFKSSKRTLKPPPAVRVPQGAASATFIYTTPRVKRATTFFVTASLGGMSQKVRLRLIKR